MDYITLVPSYLSADANDATYSCSLTNTWSAETHPTLYDTIQDSAHWSPPVLVTHSEDFELWVPDTLASPGIELVAETGFTSRLRQEIATAQSNCLAGDFVIGTDQYNALDGPQILQDIRLTSQFPIVSSMAMLAPSPDWFTGIPGFSPIDRIDGVWYEFFEVATYPWDAGTKAGDKYISNNFITGDSSRPIAQLTIDTVPANGILLNPSGTTVLPVALWSCSLQHLEISNDEVSNDEVSSDKVSTDEISNGNISTDEISNDKVFNDEACLGYFQRCVDDPDCCSKSCVRARCSGRIRRTGRDDSFRLSSSKGSETVPGGASGRYPRNTGNGSMLVEGELFLNKIESDWLRGSSAD